MRTTDSRFSRFAMNATAYLMFMALVGCAGWLEVNRGAATSLWQELRAAYLPGGADPLAGVGDDALLASRDAPAADEPAEEAAPARPAMLRNPAAARYPGGETSPATRRQGRVLRLSPMSGDPRPGGEADGAWGRTAPRFVF